MDAIDERLLGHLVRNARSTYASIGADVGLSAPAVKRRVDSLLARRVLWGFTAVLDPAALGWTTEGFVNLYCDGTVSPAVLRESLESLPEVVTACTVSGPADALVHVRASSVAHLEEVIQRLRLEPTVRRTESVIVLSRLVDRSSAGDGAVAGTA